jgi:hypothetical protein
VVVPWGSGEVNPEALATTIEPKTLNTRFSEEFSRMPTTEELMRRYEDLRTRAADLRSYL